MFKKFFYFFFKKDDYTPCTILKIVYSFAPIKLNMDCECQKHTFEYNC